MDKQIVKRIIIEKQVAYNLGDSTTYEREVGGLLKFLKTFEGYRGCIITRDTKTVVEEDGHTIEVLPVWEWLLKTETRPENRKNA